MSPLAGDYNRQDPECCAQIFVRTGATQRPLNAAIRRARRGVRLCAAQHRSVRPADRPRQRPRRRQELGGVSLRADWEVGPGHADLGHRLALLGLGAANDRDFTGLPITTMSANPSQQDQWTQELRYAGDDRRFDFVLGAFAFQQKSAHAGSAGAGPGGEPLAAQPGQRRRQAIRRSSNGLRSRERHRLKNTSLAAVRPAELAGHRPAHAPARRAPQSTTGRTAPMSPS